ncbi:MAG: M43 family zinc metalloprotease [Candidatus Kapabacteria bacterium]|nr:M43 family zinc metalloprotease [Candidatus Kapabacteria bacterium]
MKILTFIVFALTFGSIFSQAPVFNIDDVGKLTPKSQNEITLEEQSKKLFIENYINTYYNHNKKINNTLADSSITYIIPVVFHVYGPESPTGTVMQNDSPVNISVIQSALDELNKDFIGLNTDFTSVHNSFLIKRGTLNIEFRLAQIDPNGKPTNGMVIHQFEASYAKTNTSDPVAEVQADAWDNFKYMNIYVQKDWSGSGAFNLSGIAWGPDLNMSKNKMARICYNGRYLGKNCSLASNGYFSEFTGVFTHEFGHFFDLAHLFVNGSCYDTKSQDNDNVPDTPNGYNGEGCHTSPSALLPNCPFPPAVGMPQGDNPNSSLCNAENYMTYNNCYKMFSVGQVGRMVNALNHPARKPLWQTSNLIATGVFAKSDIQESSTIKNQLEIYPNPIEDKLNFKYDNISEIDNIIILNLEGKTVLSLNQPNISTTIDVSALVPGTYIIQFIDKRTKSTTTKKFVKK